MNQHIPQFRFLELNLNVLRNTWIYHTPHSRKLTAGKCRTKLKNIDTPPSLFYLWVLCECSLLGCMIVQCSNHLLLILLAGAILRLRIVQLVNFPDRKSPGGTIRNGIFTLWIAWMFQKKYLSCHLSNTYRFILGKSGASSSSHLT